MPNPTVCDTCRKPVVVFVSDKGFEFYVTTDDQPCRLGRRHSVNGFTSKRVAA